MLEVSNISIWLFIIIISSIFLLYFYYLSIKKEKKYIKILLLAIRYLVILLIIIIFIEPIISLNKKIKIPKSVAFIIDNSSSLKNEINKKDLKIRLSKFEKYLKDKDIEVNFSIFGDSLRQINNFDLITLNDQKSDFKNMLFDLKNNISDEYILISDGVKNYNDIGESQYNLGPINTFGVGNLNRIFQDISIDSIKIDEYNNDTIRFKCQINSNVNKIYKDLNIYLSNSKNTNYIISTIDVNPSSNSFFHEFYVDKNILSNNNEIFFDNLENEKILSNNYYNVFIPDKFFKKYQILLISGRLSLNTKFIKNMINDYSNVNLNHIYKNFDIIENINYDVVVFDTFPINLDQFSIVNKNIIKTDNFVFINGPLLSSDFKYLKLYLNKYDYSINPVNKINNINKLTVNNSEDIYINDLIQNIILPQFEYTVSNKNHLATIYTENNILLDYYKENLFIFIPELEFLSNKTTNIYNEDYYSLLIKHYFNQLLYKNNNKFLNIYSNNNFIYIDEEFKIYLDTDNIEIENIDISVVMYNYKGDIVLKNSNYELLENDILLFKFNIDKPGKYKFKAEMEYQEKINFSSNFLNININQRDIEIENIYLDKNNLMNISIKSGGEYYSFNELETYINSIKPNTKYQKQTNKIKIFNFQFIWFIIILLLIIEWIIRKNRGLL